MIPSYNVRRGGAHVDGVVDEVAEQLEAPQPLVPRMLITRGVSFFNAF